jgi:hypothetical protein
MKESKNPPNLVDLLANRAIAPSHPSIIPVINTKIEKHKRFLKKTKKTQHKTEKKNIITVAIFGVTLILIKPLAIRVTKGLKIYRTLNFDAILFTVL